MPGPGKSEYVRHIWSQSEQKKLADRLNLQLGKEYISYRSNGHSSKPFAYIEGWKVVQLANDVFGFNGWNSEIKDQTVDYCDEVRGRYNVGVSCIVRVTLQDGTFHEDIGYGRAENMTSKAMALEKSKKEACTDGLKRALRLFGSSMGNCVYDQNYVKHLSNMRAVPPKFDPTNLLHPESTKTVETVKAEVPHVPPEQRKPTAPLPTTVSAPPQSAANGGTTNGFDAPMSDDLDDEAIEMIDGLPRLIDAGHGEPIDEAALEETQPEPEVAAPPATGFVSARAAEAVQTKSPLPSGSQFDPTFQSPLAKNLPQDRSRPVKRNEVPSAPRVGAPPALRYATPLRDRGANAVNTPIRRATDDATPDSKKARIG